MFMLNSNSLASEAAAQIHTHFSRSKESETALQRALAYINPWVSNDSIWLEKTITIRAGGRGERKM